MNSKCPKYHPSCSVTAQSTTSAGNNALVRSYTWGLDASGSMQGAGGVGGLLMVNAGSGGVHFPAYDLNGNVMGLVNATNGNISAKYEYGPFGEVFCSVGDMAKVNPFGFSTKYTDNETDLLCYGYRYYSPALGRWLSRDPIEERGGLNLYGFVYNNPVHYVDDSGSKPFPQDDYTYSPGKSIDTPAVSYHSIYNPGSKLVVPRYSPQPRVFPIPNAAGGIVAGGIGDLMLLSGAAFKQGMEKFAINSFIKKGCKECEKRARDIGMSCYECCVIHLYHVENSSGYSEWFYSSIELFLENCYLAKEKINLRFSTPGPSLGPNFKTGKYDIQNRHTFYKFKCQCDKLLNK